VTTLNPKQKKFVREYLVDCNGTQAAIRAGYSKKTAGQIAEQLLKKLEINEALEKGQAKHAERCNVTIDSLTDEYEEARFVAKGEKQGAAMVSATTGKAKLHGMLTDKSEVDVTATVNFNTYRQPKPDDA